jgi:small subunit ribosomal protein S8e
MKYHGRSMRSKTGGRLRPNHKKRKHELGRDATETGVGDPTLRVVDARGGTRKVRALQTNVASVSDGEGQTDHAAIEGVVENSANPNYARRNIITQGAVIDTDAGQARVTSRPGQDGQVSAVLLD